MKSHKELLHQKFDEYAVEFDQNAKKKLQVEIEGILSKVTHYDSEDYHIWGLSYYSLEAIENIPIALEKLKKAHQLDTNNFLACLYIGHCYQDMNDLDNALSFYEKVDQEALKTFQIWRYVKLVEQIGYCHYKLGNKDLGRTKFEEVLTWYKRKDMDMLAAPTEIMECLEASDSIVKEIKEIEDYL